MMVVIWQQSEEQPRCDGAYFPGHDDPVMPTLRGLYGPPGVEGLTDAPLE